MALQCYVAHVISLALQIIEGLLGGQSHNRGPWAKSTLVNLAYGSGIFSLLSPSMLKDTSVLPCLYVSLAPCRDGTFCGLLMH